MKSFNWEFGVAYIRQGSDNHPFESDSLQRAFIFENDATFKSINNIYCGILFHIQFQQRIQLNNINNFNF